MKPQLREDYIDTGKVSFYFMHFPILGPNSIEAANAASCAHEQDSFWAFHDYLFDTLRSEGREAYSRELYVSAAESLGLDIGAFATCFDETRYEDQVLENLEWGRELGFTSTPVFLVDNLVVRGSRPAEFWVELFEAALEGR